MDHPRSENLQPAGMLAETASLPLASRAAHVYFHPRLHKGKIAGTEARFHFFAKKFLQKFIHRRQKIGKGDPFVDIEPSI